MNTQDAPRFEQTGDVLSIASNSSSRAGSHGIIEFQHYDHTQHSFDMLQESDAKAETSSSQGSGLLPYVDVPDEAETSFDAPSIEQLRQHLMESVSSSSQGIVSVSPIKLPASPLSSQSRQSSSHVPSPHPALQDTAVSSSLMLSPHTPRYRSTRTAAAGPPALPLARPSEIPYNIAIDEQAPPSPLQRIVSRLPPGLPPPVNRNNSLNRLKYHYQDENQYEGRNQNDIQIQNQNPKQNHIQIQIHNESQSQNQNQNHNQNHSHSHKHSQNRCQNENQVQLNFGQPRKVSDSLSLWSQGSLVTDDGHIQPSRRPTRQALSYIKRSGPTITSKESYLAGLPRLPTFPISQTCRSSDLELEKRDAWGRRQASPFVAWALLFCCAAFPPLWLLLSSGYFDSIFGVVPRTVKLTALALALFILTAVIALVTVFGVLRT